MGRRIDIYLQEGYAANGASINFDHYGVLLYYAFTVDQTKSYKLYLATTSLYHYRQEINLSVDGLDEYNSVAAISFNELPQVVDFINNDVIPSLQALPQNLDLVESWNVGWSLEVFLNNQGSFFDYFNIDDEDTEGFTPEYLISLFQVLADLFGEAISQNSIHYVLID